MAEIYFTLFWLLACGQANKSWDESNHDISGALKQFQLGTGFVPLLGEAMAIRLEAIAHSMRGEVGVYQFFVVSAGSRPGRGTEFGAGSEAEAWHSDRNRIGRKTSMG